MKDFIFIQFNFSTNKITNYSLENNQKIEKANYFSIYHKKSRFLDNLINKKFFKKSLFFCRILTKYIQIKYIQINIILVISCITSSTNK